MNVLMFITYHFKNVTSVIFVLISIHLFHDVHRSDVKFPDQLYALVSELKKLCEQMVNTK